MVEKIVKEAITVENILEHRNRITINSRYLQRLFNHVTKSKLKKEIWCLWL